MRFYKEYKYSDCYYDIGKCYTDSYQMLEDIYRKQFNTAPKSFFDVGCFNGRIMTQAEQAGVEKVYGIEPIHPAAYDNPNIECVDIEDFVPVESFDLAWVNGPLCYLPNYSVQDAIIKLHFAKMVIAKQATAEDVKYAKEHYNEDLMQFQSFYVRPEEWYINAFKQGGFSVQTDKINKCIVATSKLIR